MKRTRSQNLRLGIFVITGTILFVVAVYLIGQRQEMFTKTFRVSAYFQNVSGLQKGNNVRYAGIDIGTVHDIEMVNDSTIRVSMNIIEKITEHVKKNAIATIGSDGLVGNMIVNIVPGEGSAPRVDDGDTIDSYSKIGADDILSTLSVTNENAAILTADLLKITNAMVEGKGTLGMLVNDTLMAKNLQQTVINLKTASYNANNAIKELNTVVSSFSNENSVFGALVNDAENGEKIKGIISNLEESTVEMDKAVNNFNTLIEDFKSSEGTYNYLVKDTSLVNTLRSTMENIDEGTARFNENMEAMKHNFLLRGYFKKQERQKKKAEKSKD